MRKKTDRNIKDDYSCEPINKKLYVRPELVKKKKPSLITGMVVSDT